MDFSNTFIVDFQYLYGNAKNECFIKEMAICQLGKLDVESYCFKAPFPKQHLTNENSKKANEYIGKKFNVKWYDGDIGYLHVNRILSKLNDKKILVKGLQKQNILKQYLNSNTKIENMESVYEDIPNLKSIKNLKINCKKHFNNCNSKCAHKNVINLMMFVLNK